MSRYTADVLNVTGAVGLPDPTIGSNAQTSQVWGIDMNNLLLSYDGEFALRYSGNPNTFVASNYVGRKIWDVTNGKLWVCTSIGTALTAVWTDLFSGALTPSSVTSSGLITSTGHKVTGSTAAGVIDGMYLSGTHIVGIAANSQIVANFQTPGSGGTNLAFKNGTASGLSAITVPTTPSAALASAGAGNLSAGNYQYKIAYVTANGDTALSTASTAVNVTAPGTNGKITLTIPTSGSGLVSARRIYRTQAGGSTYYFLATVANNTATSYTDNIADATIGGSYSAPTGRQQVPSVVTLGAESSTDDVVTMEYRAKGTTTAGHQFNHMVAAGGTNGQYSDDYTGQHRFYCNDVVVLTLTDTLWNPNIIYAGPPNTYITMSNGWGANGSDGLAVITAESPNYKSDGSGSLIGAGLIIGSRGQFGELHFRSNGILHVSIDSPSNPNGNDQYCGANDLRMAGRASGGGSPVMYTGGDSTVGMAYYTGGTGNVVWNMSTNLYAGMILHYTASAANTVEFWPAINGSAPMVSAGGGSGNVPLIITGSDEAGVYLAQRVGNYFLAKFGSTGFGPADYVKGLSSGSGSGASIGTGSDSTTNAPFTINALGTGSIYLGSSSGSVVNLLKITPGTTGNAVTLEVGGGSVDATTNMTYKVTGSSGLHRFYGDTSNVMSIGGASGNNTTWFFGNGVSTAACSIQGGTNSNMLFYLPGTGQIYFQTSNTSHTVLTLKDNYDVIMGAAAAATADTAGFLWIASCAGVPSGSLSAPYSGAVALRYDRTNNQIYVNNAGTWKKTVALT